MEEKLVSFDTAVLAKEKGFKVAVTFQYQKDKTIYHRQWEPHDFNIRGLISAPTQSLLQKWLREVHNIAIVVEPWTNFHNRDEYNFDIGYLCEAICFTKEEDGKILRDMISSTGAKTYEEALEIALWKGLTMIDSPFRRKNKL